ncbi:RES family NAD+ phosphorylase [Ruegeria sp.]|uniref:RES family NAD+ phosphorylase n=1 Tax=Ruegeria sp. TaxID=1879320 RepID=UPI003C7A66F6
MFEFSGPVWRIQFASRARNPLHPARAPEGRFHHSGQFAIYASLSAEGAGIAIRRYISDLDPERVIQRLWVDKAQLVDLRGRKAVSVVWQGIFEASNPSPTWAYSDEARQQCADGLMYSSRSRPDLSHLVLFDSNNIHARSDEAPLPWTP